MFFRRPSMLMSEGRRQLDLALARASRALCEQPVLVELRAIIGIFYYGALVALLVVCLDVIITVVYDVKFKTRFPCAVLQRHSAGRDARCILHLHRTRDGVVSSRLHHLLLFYRDTARTTHHFRSAITHDSPYVSLFEDVFCRHQSFMSDAKKCVTRARLSSAPTSDGRRLSARTTCPTTPTF